MSHRHDINHHRHRLSEIREIMNSMKTLAYMETRKLSSFIHAQQDLVDSIESVAADFLAFHNDALPETETEIPVYLLMGTERGFCGDINQHLLSQFSAALHHTTHATTSHLIVIGHKLHLLLENDTRVAAFISGANISEEVPNVLQHVVQTLAELQKQQGALTLYALYHAGEYGVAMNRLLPPFQSLQHKQVPYSHPPILNIPPAEFLLELTDHYLFAALNEMLYTSLMAENHRRVMHLEGAVQHLDDESLELMRKSNQLRQEEITEEIEVILLSADSLTTAPKGKRV
ncbi:F0F1 ATP synthase subunit gamma [Pseudomonadota bacterium]